MARAPRLQLRETQTAVDHAGFLGGPNSFLRVRKSGESGLEPNKKLRGGVKAIAEGTKPGTIDVYLELATTTKDGKKVLVRGTFDETAIPCLRKDAEQEARRG